jgi:predicted Zn-dependent peptidase
MSLESSASRAEQLARQTLVFGRQIPVEELIERIDAVDVAAVRRVAGRIFAAANPAVAALGPIAGLASQGEIAARFAKG